MVLLKLRICFTGSDCGSQDAYKSINTGKRNLTVAQAVIGMVGFLAIEKFA